MKQLTERLLELLQLEAFVPSNVPELIRALGLERNEQQKLQRILRELERAGRIARVKGNRYIATCEADLIPGRIRMNRQGKGFLQSDEPRLKEILKAENATSTAMHEDRVLVP